MRRTISSRNGAPCLAAPRRATLRDGVVSAGAENPELVAFNLGMVQEGAKAAGRTLSESYHTASLGNAVVLRPGEKLTDERVIDTGGAWATMFLHFVYEIYELSKRIRRIGPRRHCP